MRGGPALVVPRQRVRLVVQEPLDELEEALLAGEVQARVPPAVARVDVPGAEEVAQAAEIIRFGALVHRRVLRREDLRALDVSKSVVVGENLNVHGNIHANGNISSDGSLTFGDAGTDMTHLDRQ